MCGEWLAGRENHQRAAQHRGAGGLDTGAQRRCRLGQPFERLRHTELTPAGPHPGDVGGVDAGRALRGGLGVARTAVVRGTRLVADEQAQRAEVLGVGEVEGHGGVVPLDAVAQRIAHAAHPTIGECRAAWRFFTGVTTGIAADNGDSGSDRR